MWRGVQEEIGLDVFVHGEPERSDMCAPFAETSELPNPKRL